MRAQHGRLADSHRPTVVSLYIFVFFANLYTLTAMGSFWASQDPVFMFGVTENLVRTRSWAVSQDVEAMVSPVGGYSGLQGPDGRLYFPKGMIYSVIMIPFYILGYIVSQTNHDDNLDRTGDYDLVE